MKAKLVFGFIPYACKWFWLWSNGVPGDPAPVWDWNYPTPTLPPPPVSNPELAHVVTKIWLDWERKGLLLTAVRRLRDATDVPVLKDTENLEEAAQERDRPKNTTYNVIDTLMHLDPDLWNQAEDIWDENQEVFIAKAEEELLMRRTVAYTYWQCIHFSINEKYRHKAMREKFPRPSEGR